MALVSKKVKIYSGVSLESLHADKYVLMITNGDFYMDTDVELLKSLDELRYQKGFCGRYNVETSGYFETKPLMDKGLSITNRTNSVHPLF